MKHAKRRAGSNKAAARELRAKATDAERRIWKFLRNRRPNGFKFRRQQPLGPYVVDFVCFEARLVIEADGSQHYERAEYDAARTRYLERCGYRVLRFWNNDILQNTEAVFDVILRALATPHPNPLPQGERGPEG